MHGTEVFACASPWDRSQKQRRSLLRGPLVSCEVLATVKLALGPEQAAGRVALFA